MVIGSNGGMVASHLKLSLECMFYLQSVEFTDWYFMCDKLRGGDMEQKPKSAYELIMKKKNVTMWFLDENCHDCGKAIYTDGKTKWCSPECKKPGTYAGIQEDYIR